MISHEGNRTSTPSPVVEEKMTFTDTSLPDPTTHEVTELTDNGKIVLSIN